MNTQPPTVEAYRLERYARAINGTYAHPARSTAYGVREERASLEAYAGMSRMQAIVATAPAARGIR